MEIPTVNSMESVQFAIKGRKEKKTTIKIFNCNVCLKEYASKKIFERHKLTHINDPIPCDICNKIQKNIGSLKKHLRIHEKERTRYKCDQCEIIFSSEYSVNRHMRIVHKSYVDLKKQKTTCTECGKSYSDKYKFAKHMLTHTTEVKQIKCPECPRKFKNKKVLDKHMDFHRNVKPFMCKICGIPFKDRGLLNKHIARHTGIAIICPYCKKKYKNKLSFKEHMRDIHKGLPMFITDGPLSCKVCEEYFENLDNLKDHVKIHNTKGPFECGHCKKLFKRKSNMKIHVLKVHGRTLETQKRKPCVPPEGPKYSCPHCDKIFDTKSKYSSHLPVHSDKRPFQCKVCKAKLKTKEYLRRHICKNISKENKIVDLKQDHVKFPVNPATIKTEIEDNHENNECLETQIEFSDYIKTEEDASFILKTENILY